MFTELGLDPRLLRALTTLTFTTPTKVQAATLPAALAGQDLLVCAETGSGKTAAFTLPILQYLLQHPAPNSATRALILTPTRELAEQVVAHIRALSQFTFIKADSVCGGEPFKPQAARLRKNPEILVGTPGRLIEHLDKQTLDFGDVAYLVLDEADRMLDMGFQEDVERIASLCPAKRQTLLFSATLTRQGLSSVITRSLQAPTTLLLDDHRQAAGQITQQVVLANDSALKDKQLAWLLQHEAYDKAFVFTNTKQAATRLNGYLRYRDIKAGVIQGDLTQEQRRHVMQLLQNGKINVLVATDVAARGIDIKGVDLVINYDMARRGDDHTHRVGRTGRAGASGLAICLIEPAEWNLMASIERYLNMRFDRRVISGLEGSYSGPKKLKASGKAAGKKQKKTDRPKTGKTAKKGAKKIPRNNLKGPIQNDGFTPLKKR